MSIEAMKVGIRALVEARKIRFAQWRHGCDCEDEHTCDPLQDKYARQFNDAIIDLENAIAEAEKQEPVAVVTGVYGGRFTYAPFKSIVVLPVGAALYLQTPQRTWVGLTDETLDDVYFCVEGSATPLETWREQARTIEAKLKEKNSA